MNAISFSEDKWLHPGVPLSSSMPEMDPGLKQFLHVRDRHRASSVQPQKLVTPVRKILPPGRERTRAGAVGSITYPVLSL